MRYLSLEEVLFLHDDLIKTYGGSLGIRDANLLESAVFRPQSTFGEHDLYPSVFDKAATLLHGILFNHPFVDGNKRTAVASAAAFLAKNGWQFTSTTQELVAFPLAVEKTHPEVSEIALWLQEHAVKNRGVLARTPR